MNNKVKHSHAIRDRRLECGATQLRRLEEDDELQVAGELRAMDSVVSGRILTWP